MPALPRAQSMPRDFGFSGFGFNLRMMPSSTTAMTEHLLGQSSQVVGTSRRSAAAPSFFLFEQETDDTSAPPAAAPDVYFRNLRRSILAPPASQPMTAAYLPHVSGCSESAAWLMRYVCTSRSWMSAITLVSGSAALACLAFRKYVRHCAWVLLSGVISPPLAPLVWHSLQVCRK